MPVSGSVVAALAAALVAQPALSLKAHSGTVATLEMHMYRSDCGKSRALTSRSAVRRAARMPGAGMDPTSITPFDKVLKDGFYEVECVKDMLFTYGDKFHDNKFEYNLGEIANVSIVHYDSLVAKEDREPMTHEVCFDFCRTIPDMSFFGLQNGRMCYCAPFFKAMESDSTMCDAVCPGNPTTMCGGKMKSSIFAMHMCDDTSANLAETTGKMTEVDGDMMALQTSLNATWKGMQSAAAVLQAAFGSAGDPVASDLMQTAKVFAGDMEEAAGKASTLSATMGSLKGSADGLAASFTEGNSPVKDAEASMADMEEAAAQGEALAEEMEGLLKQGSPNLTNTVNASAAYYPVMYFVDKAFVDVPSTCGGAAAEKPMMGDMDACARACDADLHECVGFSFFPPAGEATTGLCFLMSKMKTATYYTACGAAADAAPETTAQPTQPGGGRNRFLQRRAVAQTRLAAEEVKCVVKFAEFEGATLKPNPSGKCDLCLKEATKADRCFV